MTHSTRTERRARLEPLLEAARRIADARSEHGTRARRRLVASSGLSPEGVDFALTRCLETNPTEAEMDALLRSTAESPRAHLLLSANVFVAAHRAIAIGLAASSAVHVRASRREPEMAELLLEGAPGAFQLQSELAPERGDQLWAYGSDDTLASVAHGLTPGVVFHAHGSGFGVGVIGGRSSDSELESVLARLAEDIALFDQRGCLSPRVLFVAAAPELALDIARELARELALMEARVPRGLLEPREAAQIALYRDAASYAGEVFEAGLGFVSVHSKFLLPPEGRNLHVVPTQDAAQSLATLAPLVTTCSVEGSAELRRALEPALPGARWCEFGQMQRPPFDGPVDRRARQF